MTKIRNATLADLPQVSSLQRRHDLEAKPQEEWERFWLGNPARGALPIGWVIADESRGAGNEVAGFLGNIPLEYYFQGTKLLAAATHSLVVEEAYRQHVLPLVARFVAQREPGLLLNTTANVEAERIFSAMKFRRVPAPDYDVALYWITEPRGFAESALRKHGVAAPLARFAAIPASLAPGFLFSASARADSAGSRIEVLSGFASDFDAFWARLSARSRFLLAARNPETLVWRYERARETGRLKILGRRDAEGRLAAYALLYREDVPKTGLKRVRLLDFQAMPGENEALESLVAAAIVMCREEGIHMFEAIGFEGATRARLKAMGARSRRLPAWMFYFKARDAELDKALQSEENWNPSSYDGDGGL